ncbi:MAG: 50S ribosomal protein L1 [Nanoarchaeota archaeon]|nr:50S ribosomal protein L1 [Nanoarchaeota archaeon]MBU1005562.1 50S ribosomal protein L1 [Nanoarchaeota archaeon]MBU1946055.1 50S ribosomal protein L1 [Nanoarchaeota archaeon]
MNKEQVIETLKKVKEISPKRNFTQSYDLIINLKDLDLKKPEQTVNTYVTLHYGRGKTCKICAIVGPELMSSAKEICDFTISTDDFAKYTTKKDIRKLANSYDFFIAQATVMPNLAKVFGRVFGPKGKMPNPKAGCVVPPNANLKPLYDKLQKTIKIQTKNDPIVQAAVGTEAMKDEEVIDNIMATYDTLIHQLPSGKDNIKRIFIKTSMGKAVEVGKGKEESADDKEKTEKKKSKKKAAKADEAKTEETPAEKEEKKTKAPKK